MADTETASSARAAKVAKVADVRERLAATDAVVLTEYRGLNVPEMAELRTKLREAGAEYRIYKNTLVRFAARELELDIEEHLIGPTALALAGSAPEGDPVSMAKALTEFARDNDKLVIKGGLLDGSALSPDDITALSKIAPREVLLAQLAGAMAAPMQQFAGLLQALPQNFAYALKALIEQGGAPGAPPATEAPTEGGAAPSDGAEETAAAGSEETAAVGGEEAAAGSDETAAGSEDEVS